MIHELKHSSDNLSGVTQRVREKLKNIQKNSSLTDQDIRKLELVILEQRAYSRQAEYLFELEKTGYQFKINNFLSEENVTFSQYLSHFEAVHVENYKKFYLNEALAILNRDDWSRSLKKEYIQLVRKNLYPTRIDGLLLKELNERNL